MNKVLIIAEAGVNHNGDIKIAKKMIDAAVVCGVDIIKFQTVKVEALVTRNAEQADYQINNTKNRESQMEMLKKITMPYHDFDEIYEYCRYKGVQFLSTPFDLESVEFLKKYKMPFWKIPSGEITNYPYLVAIAKTGKNIVMSTDAEKSGRNDILLNNRKISGNAYYRTDYVGLHHGTMLLSFQSNMISKCLTPNKYKLESKSIKSVSARVGNIHMYHPDITIDMIKKAVKENFSEYFMEKETELSEGIEIANSELQSLSKKYSSEEWIYGKYNSEIGFSKQFAWGNINIIVSMEKDKIKKCNLESDAMNGQLINNLADILPVYTYNNEFKSNILKELQKRKVQFDKVMVDDIFEYLKEVIGE